MNDIPLSELPVGAIAILHKILLSGVWYKDEPKQTRLIVDAVSADDALPKTPPPPVRVVGEDEATFDARDEAWANERRLFAWNERHKAAAKTCVKFYIKGGNLASTKSVVALITLLNLGDE